MDKEITLKNILAVVSEYSTIYIFDQGEHYITEFRDKQYAIRYLSDFVLDSAVKTISGSFNTDGSINVYLDLDAEEMDKIGW